MILQGDSTSLPLADSSVDAVVTDPPYGLEFMGKDWDRAVPPVAIWKEVLRVMKPGAFAAILCSPRQDLQSRMIVNFEGAGFCTGFTSIMWTYATGFPKAGNLSKLADRRRRDDVRPVCRFLRRRIEELGVHIKTIAAEFGFHPRMVEHWAARDTDSQPTVPTWDQWLQLKGLLGFGDKMDDEVARLNHRKGTLGDAWHEREVIGERAPTGPSWFAENDQRITAPSTPEARELEGAYAGFQPKPAFEPVLIVMKPLTEKTYLDQALANGKGCSWLDDARIPTDTLASGGKPTATNNPCFASKGNNPCTTRAAPHDAGRFPANVLCCDDALNDGRVSGGGQRIVGGTNRTVTKHIGQMSEQPRTDAVVNIGDAGSYSRYFDLDQWWVDRIARLPESVQRVFPWLIVPKPSKREKNAGLEEQGNHHVSVKPVRLMSYLVTLFSRVGEVVLDPFVGSGSTGVAAEIMARRFVGVELDHEYAELAERRERFAAARDCGTMAFELQPLATAGAPDPNQGDLFGEDS
ncbi:hypothetical protein LCGC14_0259450 [marine sediment metagenome]|uniref:DNA methylase N-4/N-6 domain-containing protein n=1 Tax=marine sediment metagenome TaxID=412755 RepID=A0A0F9U2L7_9ZZZZ